MSAIAASVEELRSALVFALIADLIHGLAERARFM
jgi:hypothetical protein